MKKYLPFLFLLLWSSIVGAQELAWMNPYVAGGVATASCGVTDSQETQDGYAILGEDVTVDSIYRYTAFTATGQIFKTAYVYLKKNNSPTFNIRMYVYATSSSKPTGSPICTADADYLSSNLTTSYQWIKFQFGAGCSLNNGTKYALVLMDVEGTVSGSSIVMWGLNSSGTNGGYGYSADGSTWTANNNDDVMDFKLTTCAE